MCLRSVEEIVLAHTEKKWHPLKDGSNLQSQQSQGSLFHLPELAIVTQHTRLTRTVSDRNSTWSQETTGV